MGKKFVKILVVILILGGIAGGAYYFTDGFGTKNTSIIGNWQKENEDSAFFMASDCIFYRHYSILDCRQKFVGSVNGIPVSGKWRNGYL